MPVTTRIISADSGSSLQAERHLEVGRSDPGEDVCEISRSSAGSDTSARTAITDTPKAASIASDAMAPIDLLRQPRAPKVLTRNPTNGRSGIQRSIARLPSQLPERVWIERFDVPEERDDEGEPDRRFGGGDGDDEKHDDLPVRRPRKWPNAMNVRLTAFSMTSIDSSTVMMLRRSSTPAVPIVNSTPDRIEVVVQLSH